MQSTKPSVEEVFAADGPLSGVLPAYRPRAEQIRCAKGVDAALQDGTIYLAEVATGIGKSFAYLAPAMLWALEDPERRIVISTATIILQRQLMDKDIPTMLKALGLAPKCDSSQYGGQSGGLKVALLQGRGNYLCLSRLKQAAFDLELSHGVELERIADWAARTKTGTRESMPFAPSAELWEAIRSDRFICSAKGCNPESCFYARARELALEAQVLVVNHALLYSDLALRLANKIDLDEQALLPPYQVVICDEAHNIEKSAEKAGSLELSLYAFDEFESHISYGLRQLSIAGISFGQELIKALRLMKARFSELSELLISDLDTLQAKDLSALSPATGQQLTEAILAMREMALELHGSAKRALNKQAVDKNGDPLEAASYLNLALEEILSLATYLDHIATRDEDSEHVYWTRILRTQGTWTDAPKIELIRTPLDVGPFMRDALFNKARSLICMSATLQGAKSFAYWRSRVGLGPSFDDVVDEYVATSPFALSDRMLICVPVDAPSPTMVAAHTAYMIDLVSTAVAQNPRGGSLVLFTSYQQMMAVASELSDELGNAGRKLLVQGRGSSRASLLREFKASPGAVLLATASFWEGVDAPGRALNLLIIAKLPFDQLGDPVLEARGLRLKEQGYSPFAHLSLPRTALRLKQGVGRLMRREQDSGVVIIADSRMVHKSYGSYLFDFLPPAQISTKALHEQLEDLEYYLDLGEDSHNQQS